MRDRPTWKPERAVGRRQAGGWAARAAAGVRGQGRVHIRAILRLRPRAEGLWVLLDQGLDSRSSGILGDILNGGQISSELLAKGRLQVLIPQLLTQYAPFHISSTVTHAFSFFVSLWGFLAGRENPVSEKCQDVECTS